MDLISIILTLISAIGAVTCAIFAYKSMHLSHIATILITNTYIKNGNFIFEITNYGPGIAHNVYVEYTRSLGNNHFEQLKSPQNNLILKNQEMKTISTPMQGIYLTNEFIVRWKSITGKKFESRVINSSIYNSDVN